MEINLDMPDNSFIENVLIMQGGGSLGAFGCGVFKALRKNNVKLHILAGTSIGGVNAALIAGSKEQDRPELALEQFWLEIAENSVNLIFLCLNGWQKIMLPRPHLHYWPLTYLQKSTHNTIYNLNHFSPSTVQQFMEMTRCLYLDGDLNIH